MASDSQREPGWYWVRRGSRPRLSDQLKGWRIGEYDPPGHWVVGGLSYAGRDELFVEIGPRIYPPGEDRERDELQAALKRCADLLTYPTNPSEAVNGAIKQARTALRRLRGVKK